MDKCLCSNYIVTPCNFLLLFITTAIPFTAMLALALAFMLHITPAVPERFLSATELQKTV